VAELTRCVLCRMANVIRQLPPRSPGEYECVTVSLETRSIRRVDDLSGGVHFQTMNFAAGVSADKPLLGYPVRFAVATLEQLFNEFIAFGRKPQTTIGKLVQQAQ